MLSSPHCADEQILNRFLTLEVSGLHTGQRVPVLPVEEADSEEAAADGALCSPHPLRSVPGDLQLQQFDFPPQEIVLLLAPGHFQMNHRVSVVHNFTNLCDGRVS